MSYEGRIVYTPTRRPNLRKTFYRKWVFILGFAFLLMALLGGLTYIARMPNLQVRNIFFEGVEILEKEELEKKTLEFMEGNYAYFIPKSSLALVSAGALEQFLSKEFLAIASIKVSKRYPDTLGIYLKERKPWGIFCINQASGCVYLDHTGFAYESAPGSMGSLILKIKSDYLGVEIGASPLSTASVEYLERIRRGFLETLGLEIVGFELLAKIPSEIRARTQDGFEVYLSRDDDLEKTLRILKPVLGEEIGKRRKDLEYIDARFGSKVFFRLKD